MFFQKPLRRIAILEVGEKSCLAETRSVSFKPSEKKASKEDFSQLPASPAAKIIKKDELRETSTQTSNQYVVLSYLFILAHLIEEINLCPLHFSQEFFQKVSGSRNSCYRWRQQAILFLQATPCWTSESPPQLPATAFS